MKKLTAILLCALLLAAAVPAYGESAVEALERQYTWLENDNLTWSYDASSKTVTVSGEGPMRDYREVAPEWETYGEEAEHVVIGDGVTSVSAGAFMWFSQIVTVRLGASVEFIGDSAFDNCSCLMTVNFPDGLRYIDDYAFNNTLLHSETGFAFPEGLLHLGEGSFRSAIKEAGVTLPASLTGIGKGAFANAFVTEFRVDENNAAYASVDGVLYDKNITTLINYPPDKSDRVYEVPETVTAILSEAIEVTNDLERIVIPAGVQTIEEEAIFWNYALTSVDVDENSANFKSEDGVLFTKDGRLLLCYPIASDRKEYTVPAGTERICRFAMSQAEHLTAIRANEGLREIGGYALAINDNLRTLELPASLEKIEAGCFWATDALKEISFAGSAADWARIEIGESNEPLTDGSVKLRTKK